MESVYEMFEDLRQRPGMYLGKKSITLLDVYFGGYIHDEFKSNPNYHTSFFGFTDFVRKYHNGSLSKGWPTLILDAVNGNEEKAVDLFYELLDEFLIGQNQIKD